MGCCPYFWTSRRGACLSLWKWPSQAYPEVAEVERNSYSLIVSEQRACEVLIIDLWVHSKLSPPATMDNEENRCASSSSSWPHIPTPEDDPSVSLPRRTLQPLRAEQGPSPAQHPEGRQPSRHRGGEGKRRAAAQHAAQPMAPCDLGDSWVSPWWRIPCVTCMQRFAKGQMLILCSIALASR